LSCSTSCEKDLDIRLRFLCFWFVYFDLEFFRFFFRLEI
jgi:hypothetical protein